MKIGIIGSGSFGCALAYVFSKKNSVKLWSYTKEECDSINNLHCCMLSPNIKLPLSVTCSEKYEEVVKNSDIIIYASPSNVLRSTCEKIKEYITNQDFVIAAKGMEEDKVLSLVAKEELGINISVISGPARAEEIASDVLTFVEYSGNVHLKDILETEFFKLSYSQDIIGMQIGAAFKNVISLACGIAEGLGYKTNTFSYIVTEGLNEIKKIGLVLGAKESTFYGLSGLGDLLTTAFSPNSRNKRAGILFSKGKRVDDVKKEIGMIVEGITALNNAYLIINKYHLDCPLILNLYHIIYNGKDPHELI